MGKLKSFRELNVYQKLTGSEAAALTIQFDEDLPWTP